MAGLRRHWPLSCRHCAHRYPCSLKPFVHVDTGMQDTLALCDHHLRRAGYYYDRRTPTRQVRDRVGVRERARIMAAFRRARLWRHQVNAGCDLYGRVPRDLCCIYRRAPYRPSLPDVHVLHDMAIPEAARALSEHEAQFRRILQRLNGLGASRSHFTFTYDLLIRICILACCLFLLLFHLILFLCFCVRLSRLLTTHDLVTTDLLLCLMITYDLCSCSHSHIDLVVCPRAVPCLYEPLYCGRLHRQARAEAKSISFNPH